MLCVCVYSKTTVVVESKVFVWMVRQQWYVHEYNVHVLLCVCMHGKTTVVRTMKDMRCYVYVCMARQQWNVV